MKIVVDYSDGRHSFREATPADAAENVSKIADTTVAMWRAVVDADRVMQEQLLALSNEAYVRRHPGEEF